MKKFIFLMLLGFSALAQSVEIMPGSILPQVTTSQRTSIASPKNGMLVFDTNTQSYWFIQSGAWVELPKAGSTANYWELNGLGGNEIKNTNSGGFWSANSTGLNGSASNTSNPPIAPVNGDGTRLMWIANRSAFRAGTVGGGLQSWDADNIGLFSTAFGYNTKAKGLFSIAMGLETTAQGNYSTSMGVFTTASGNYSASMGYFTTASGYYSTSLGSNTTASGYYSTSLGFHTTASGYYSTAMGNQTTASGENTTAMGARVSTNNMPGSFIIGDQYIGSTLLNAGASNRYYARFRNGYYLYTSANNSYGVYINGGGTSWITLSDSTRKENFISANTEHVLHSVSKMRVGTWNYKGQDPSSHRHWGVMAQDFYTYFGKDSYGTIGNDTSIATADFDGVAFAALKGLEERTGKLKVQNEQLEKELAELKANYSSILNQNSSLLAQNLNLTDRIQEIETSTKHPRLVPIQFSAFLID